MSSQIKGDQPKLLQVWIGRLAVPIDAAAKQTVNEYNWLTLGISGFFDGVTPSEDVTVYCFSAAPVAYAPVNKITAANIPVAARMKRPDIKSPVVLGENWLFLVIDTN